MMRSSDLEVTNLIFKNLSIETKMELFSKAEKQMKPVEVLNDQGCTQGCVNNGSSSHP